MRRRGDGDGWVDCLCGARHWGRYGAAGLLLVRDGRVLLQHRAEWSHHGGTWGVPGGAMVSTEDPVTGAIREAAEEAGVEPALVRPAGCYVDDHRSWSYTTVLAEATGDFSARPTDAESIAVDWVPVETVRDLPLHPSLAAAWADLDALVGRRLVLVVDVANVMGSRPDGWWRDRPRAATRLLDRLAVLLAGVDGSLLGPAGTPQRLRSWLPDVVAVVEGAARAADTGSAEERGLRVVRATSSGDDAVVEAVAQRRRERPADTVVVVSADRGLVARVERLGASAVGPRTLQRALPD